MCWEENEEILPIIKNPSLQSPTLCEVREVLYEFPRTKENPLNLLKIVTVYTLRVCDKSNIEFKVKWFNIYKGDIFLI